MKSRWICISLIMVMGLTIFPASTFGSTSTQQQAIKPYVTPFTDVSNDNWAHSYIYKCAGACIISGYPGGTFGPNKTITNSEFAKMLVVPLNLSCTYNTSTFSDVSNSNWARSYIETAKENGLLYDDGSGKFNPNVPITREYVAFMVGKAIEMSVSPKKTTMGIEFTDSNSINKAFKDAIATTVDYGLVKGYPDGTFGPKKNITRAEAAKIMAMANELIDDVTLPMPILGEAPYVAPIDDSLYSEWETVYSDVELECDGITRIETGRVQGDVIEFIPLTGNEPWSAWTNSFVIDQINNRYNENGELIVLVEKKIDSEGMDFYRTKSNYTSETVYIYHERYLLTDTD